MSQISIETLRALLDYNPETGDLTWKPRPVSMFKAPRDAAAWNARYAGRPALTTINGCGYLTGGIFDRQRLAHRVAWAICHGEWPVDQIDHQNGDRTDNRISNLRVVSHSENGRNQKRPRTNTSGVIGVSWSLSAGKWRALITADGARKHLGYFADFYAAVAARKAAEAEHGFHPHHGRPE